jgi:hypothetical protein
MTPQFREEFGPRGRVLKSMGYSIEKMPVEDLYALFGYLLTVAADRYPEIRLAQEAPLGSPPGGNHPHSDPPKNDGLVEG